MSGSRFARFAWFVLAYNVAVIVFGAFVRASYSGDGCGSYWPTCGGELVPSLWDAKKAVEFSHRAMSALDGVLVLALLVWALLRHRKVVRPESRAVVWSAGISMIFVIFEALIGRGLVTFGWVAYDKSAERAVVQSVHLANTFILLGVLALTAVWAGGVPLPRLKGQAGLTFAFALALAGMLLLGVSGAVTALGDALFPVTGSSQAVIDSLDPTKHFLVRLRTVHPLLAGSVGLYLLLMAGLVANLRPTPQVQRLARLLAGVFVLQMTLGLVNVLLKAPIPLQLIHLAVADLQWTILVYLGACALAAGVERVESRQAPSEVQPLRGLALAKAYLMLTKPRVISLLLFTTLAAMFMAAEGWPSIWALFTVAIGGYLAAGAANTINMVLERDLDVQMKRTSRRPTVTQQISSDSALRFGFAQALGSFALLWWAANLLSAMLALAGLVFYVIVYTILLKRRTWQNIVIGGAAGSFPPLGGWAAVTGNLSPLAWTLFAIVFLWTPVHFWALALLIKDDYARAGVPMLPVVKGERATAIQIGLYGVLTVAVTLLPVVQREAGTFYLWVAVGLNVLLLVRCYALLGDTRRPKAVSLYKYSMAYLALIFVAIAVDRAASATTAISPAQTRASLGYGPVQREFRAGPAHAGMIDVRAILDSSHEKSPVMLLGEGSVGADIQA